MEYIIITIILFALELIYFKIADKYNIIDKPNHRSSHTEITLRGGGIIFPFAFLLFLASNFIKDNESFLHNYYIFGGGLLMICTISFLDDIYDISSKIRLIFHFVAVTLLLYFVSAFYELPLYVIPVLYIIVIGILNAYNFMDGINGITSLYSLAILFSLLYVNEYMINFVEKEFIIYPILATIVFLFFNFRKKAKSFLGDIGSMGIAFWVLALLGLLMFKTHDLKWFLFLTLYGIDVVFTIIERLKLKENIFEAHRRHLYQLLSNEKKIDHRIISFFYTLLQIFINIFVINSNTIIFSFFMVIIPTIILYLFLKISIKKNVSNN